MSSGGCQLVNVEITTSWSIKFLSRLVGNHGFHTPFGGAFLGHQVGFEPRKHMSDAHVAREMGGSHPGTVGCYIGWGLVGAMQRYLVETLLALHWLRRRGWGDRRWQEPIPSFMINSSVSRASESGCNLTDGSHMFMVTFWSAG